VVRSFGRFLGRAALIGLVLIIVMPVGGVIVAGLLFPIILAIGLPLLLLMVVVSWVASLFKR